MTDQEQTISRIRANLAAAGVDMHEYFVKSEELFRSIGMPIERRDDDVRPADVKLTEGLQIPPVLAKVDL